MTDVLKWNVYKKAGCIYRKSARDRLWDSYIIPNVKVEISSMTEGLHYFKSFKELREAYPNPNMMNLFEESDDENENDEKGSSECEGGNGDVDDNENDFVDDTLPTFNFCTVCGHRLDGRHGPCDHSNEEGDTQLTFSSSPVSAKVRPSIPAVRTFTIF